MIFTSMMRLQRGVLQNLYLIQNSQKALNTNKAIKNPNRCPSLLMNQECMVGFKFELSFVLILSLLENWQIFSSKLGPFNENNKLLEKNLSDG
jgi:hypothetical protein